MTNVSDNNRSAKHIRLDGWLNKQAIIGFFTMVSLQNLNNSICLSFGAESAPIRIKLINRLNLLLQNGDTANPFRITSFGKKVNAWLQVNHVTPIGLPAVNFDLTQILQYTIAGFAAEPKVHL